mmetsp:Transcript_34762/g.57955  ORF Transcript_34762/g.57955 Transcript_34762/m.57955 type:complete len:229 (-) Transcript_34762:35-721(-)
MSGADPRGHLNKISELALNLPGNRVRHVGPLQLVQLRLGGQVLEALQRRGLGVDLGDGLLNRRGRHGGQLGVELLRSVHHAVKVGPRGFGRGLMPQLGQGRLGQEGDDLCVHDLDLLRLISDLRLHNGVAVGLGLDGVGEQRVGQQHPVGVAQVRLQGDGHAGAVRLQPGQALHGQLVDVGRVEVQQLLGHGGRSDHASVHQLQRGIVLETVLEEGPHPPPGHRSQGQ